MMKRSPRGLVILLENIPLILDTQSFQRASDLLLQLARTHFATGAYRGPFQRSFDSAIGFRLQQHAQSNPHEPIDARSLFRKAFITLSRKREFRPPGQQYFSDLDETMLKIEKGSPRNFPLFHDADRFFTLLRRVKKQQTNLDEFPWIDAVVAVGPTRQGKNPGHLLRCSGLRLGGIVSPGSMSIPRKIQNHGAEHDDVDILFDDSITAYGGFQRILAATKAVLPDVLQNRNNPNSISAESYDFLHIGANADMAAKAGYGTLTLDRQMGLEEPNFDTGVISDLRDVKRSLPCINR